MKNITRLRLNQLGFGHFVLAAVIVVVGMASFGVYQVVSGSAATRKGVISIRTSEGCWLAGRKWDSKANKCLAKCRNSDTKFNKNASDGGFCSGHVWIMSNVDFCTDRLHRYYLSDVNGCARKRSQADGRSELYCQPGYPYYNADYYNRAEDEKGKVDYCEKSKKTAIQNEKNGTPGSTSINNSSNGGNQSNATGGGQSPGASNGGGSNTNSGSSSDGSYNSENSTDTLKVATYNVLTSGRATKLGGPAGFDARDEARMKGIAKLIAERNLSIVATQEVRPVERQALLKYLPEYYSASKNRHFLRTTDDVIFWDSRKFKDDGFGTYSIPKLGGSRSSVWLKLVSRETSNPVFIYSMHADLSSSGRVRGANVVLSSIAKQPNAPILVMGDMNSNMSDRGRDEVYRTFKSSGKLAYTYEVTRDAKNGNCDTHNSPEDGRQDCRKTRGSHIDQIWVSKRDANVLLWNNIATSETIKLSDHNPVIVELKVRGM